MAMRWSDTGASSRASFHSRWPGSPICLAMRSQASGELKSAKRQPNTSTPYTRPRSSSGSVHTLKPSNCAATDAPCSHAARTRVRSNAVPGPSSAHREDRSSISFEPVSGPMWRTPAAS